MTELYATVVQHIQQQAQSFPHQRALLWLVKDANADGWQKESWTYQEVWCSATSCASRLKSLVGVGCHVAICVDEGPLLPLVELGVLLAAMCIVPLDPCEPTGRFCSVLMDSEPALIVAKDPSGRSAIQQHLASELLPAGWEKEVVLAAELVVPLSGADVEAPSDGAAISHIFFTSGSTGRPKGCVVAHRALESYCRAKNEAYHVTRDATVLVASAFTFDPSMGDFMSAWSTGACVALGPRLDLFQHLGHLLDASKASHLLCTPSLFATLEGTDAAVSSLQCVALGGEAMPKKMVETWAPRLSLFNTYGVTECCVYNTFRRMQPLDVPNLLGSPLVRNRVLVMPQDALEDGSMRLESLDAEQAEGELIIAGAQVGEGYLKRPELTARQFRQHLQHGKLYLSGDLVRLVTTVDGQTDLQLLGRKDHQVKVRGQRIELQEVEHLLLQCVAALVTALAVGCFGDRLVAFCVPTPALSLEIKSSPRIAAVLRALIRFLSEKEVPRGMRPRIVICSALPLTATGKVARGELGKLLTEEDSEDEAETPLQGFPWKVAEIWAQELGQQTKRIKWNSHFMELGGHSISALRVCRRLVQLNACEGSSQEEDAPLGGDLGELSGTFSPQELLQRPKFLHYVQFLQERCEPGEGSIDVKDEEPGDGDEDAVQLLHRACAAGSTVLIDFLIGHGFAPVDGHCSSKRLKELRHPPLPGEKFATDTGACKWRSFANASTELAQSLDRQNELWGIWPLPLELQENLKKPRGERKSWVVSFSHFLPALELMPEKRFLFTPNLTQIVGSSFIQQRVKTLQPDLHIFGHSHFPWDMTLSDGVRYKSWPLATPAEQARRISSYPSKEIEEWHPLPVFDSLGRHYPTGPACWYSLMYTRLRRDPQSYTMADFVADVYCPEAPRVPGSILSPGGLIPINDQEQLDRRERYAGKSAASMKREMKNWASAS